MVSFVEDEFHFARQSSVFFVILQDDVLEVHFHRYGRFGTDALHRTAFEAATQEFHVRFRPGACPRKCCRCVLSSLRGCRKVLPADPLHGLPRSSGNPAPSARSLAGLYQHFVVHAFEDGACYGSRELRRIRGFEDVDVLRTDYDVHLCTVAETGIHAVELVFAEADEPVVHHDTVQYVALADEVGYERLIGSL